MESTNIADSAQLAPSTSSTPVGTLAPKEKVSLTIRELENGFLVEDYFGFPSKTFAFPTLEEALVKANDIFLAAKA